MLTDSPSAAAASSTLTFRASGRRSVVREVLASSRSTAAAGRSSASESPVAVGDDELDLASAQPHVDRAGREITGDLAGGGREGVEQHEPGRGIQAGGEALGDGASVLRAVRRGVHQLALQVADVLSKFHVHHYDTTVVSCQVKVVSSWRRGRQK